MNNIDFDYLCFPRKQNDKQWTETVLAKDYIEFLDLLWKRVRPDLLFPPPPLPEGEKPPPIFSTTMFKVDEPNSRTKDRKTQRGRRNRRSKAAPDASSSFLENAEFRGETASLRFYGRPPPPHPLPPPRTPIGLLSLHIPGFRPREAQRAAWVGKGGLIDPEVEQLLRPIADFAGAGGEDVCCSSQEQQLGLEEVKEPSWKQRRRQRLLAAGVVEEREDFNRRSGVGRAGRKYPKEKEDMDSIWDFAARNFPVDPQEVSGREPWGWCLGGCILD